MINDLFNAVEGLASLKNIYEELEKETALFQEKTAVCCPEGCGICCITSSKNIEASIFEMILPAAELWINGDAGLIIERLEKFDPEESCCVLFIPADENQNGRCRMYRNRCLFCRLFGFSGFKDKYDKLRFTTCARIKNGMQDKIKKTEEMINNGLSLPLSLIYRNKIIDLNPMLAQKLYPINTAIYMALIKTGYYLKSIING